MDLVAFYQCLVKCDTIMLNHIIFAYIISYLSENIHISVIMLVKH